MNIKLLRYLRLVFTTRKSSRKNQNASTSSDSVNDCALLMMQ